MTPADAIESWLRSKARLNAFASCFGGLALLLVSSVILFVLFWVVYVVLYLGIEWAYPLSHTARLWLSGGGLGLLFVANFMSDPRLSERMAVSTGTLRKKPATVYIPFMGRDSTDDLPARNSVRAHARFLGEIVLIGPRLATAGVLSLIHAWGCYRLDSAGCAAVLALLLERKEPVSFKEIATVIPSGHDVRTVLTQVQDIEGVHIYEGKPDGLGLFDNLRQELRRRTRSGPVSRRKKSGAKRKDRDKEKPPPTLVLLLREPRDLDAELLTQLVNKTFGLNLVGRGERDRTEFVVGDDPVFMAQFHERIFQIMSLPKPYFDDPESVVAGIKELRLRQAVAAHGAWLSVVLMHEYVPAGEGDVYWHLGKLLAALAPRDTLAVLWPDRMQFRLWDNNVKRLVAEGQPLEALRAFPEKVPVIGIEQDDPRMQAAIAEARRRWPEFVAAFNERRSDQKFAVKMPIDDGEHLEYMWLTVLSLDGDVIRGTLDSEPAEVTSVRLGSEVYVSRQELTDWLYTDGDEMKGGFTVKAIEDLLDS